MADDQTSQDRYERGRAVILDIWGPDEGAAILDRWHDLSPDLERQIVEYMFGDRWALSAPAPDRKTRSLVHVATLTALHRPTQLRVHLIGALRNHGARNRRDDPASRAAGRLPDLLGRPRGLQRGVQGVARAPRAGRLNRSDAGITQSPCETHLRTRFVQSDCLAIPVTLPSVV
jgi:hypothetical protein